MIRSHSLAIAALALLSASPAAAQGVGKDPAPAAPRRRTTPAPATRPPAGRPAARPAARPAEPARTGASALQGLADADLAFGKRAGTAGLRDAMLAVFADDAVLFQPRAIRARPWIAASTPPAGATTWAPAWVAASAAGELGLTTGPIAVNAATPDSVGNGQYVTVWTRAGTAAEWKALVHFLVPGPAATAVPFATHISAGDGRPRGGPGAAEAVRATLFIADRGLALAAAAEGIAVALARVAVPDTHVLRDGSLPFIGVDSLRAGLAARDKRLGGRLRWQTEDVRIARSGDMGVTYGVFERRSTTDAVTESGNYVRFWERQADGGWRVLLDAAAPLRP